MLLSGQSSEGRGSKEPMQDSLSGGSGDGTKSNREDCAPVSVRACTWVPAQLPKGSWEGPDLAQLTQESDRGLRFARPARDVADANIVSRANWSQAYLAPGQVQRAADAQGYVGRETRVAGADREQVAEK